MSDPLEELLGRLCNGDLEAAEQVFRAYEPYLRKVVRRQLPDPFRAKFDSADVIQSVWADLLQGFREAGWRFPDAAHLRAFLLTATRNRFIDRVRQNRTAVDRGAGEGPGLAELPADREDRPSEVAQANELWEQMLALCPPGHRAVLELKREGFSATEIAQRTGLHEDSVRRIFRELARRLALRRPLASPTSP